MSNEFDFKFKGNFVTFHNVIVFSANVHSPISYDEKQPAKYRLRFLIPKNEENTKRFISELSQMYDVTEGQIYKETKTQMASLKEADQLSTDDQDLKKILGNYYVMISTSPEERKPEVISLFAVTPLLSSFDIVNVRCRIKVIYAKTGKSFRYEMQTVVLKKQAGTDDESRKEALEDLLDGTDFKIDDFITGNSKDKFEDIED